MLSRTLPALVGCLGGVLSGCEAASPSLLAPAERGNVLQRALNTLRFLWVLCQAMVDGLTQWLDACTREHADMSTVLRLERYVLTRRLAKVTPPGKGQRAREGGDGGTAPALTPCPPQGEDVHRGVLDELYLLPPEEPPEEPSQRVSGGADPQNGVASRQVHRSPGGCPPGAVGLARGALTRPRAVPSGRDGAERGRGAEPPPGSQEQGTSWGSQEDVAGSRELLALPQNRSRTASELLLSRYGVDTGTGMGTRWVGGAGSVPVPPPPRRLYFVELEESEQFYQSHNRFLKLLLALYRCVAAHSELLCYFVIILNNMVTASVISLFLPILVFLWAMLSIPRPTKRFWMTAIIFTEVGRGWPGKGGRGHDGTTTTTPDATR